MNHYDISNYSHTQRKVRISNTRFPDVHLVKQYYIPILSIKNCIVDWDVLNECYNHSLLAREEIVKYCSSFIESYESEYNDLIVEIAFEDNDYYDFISCNLKKLAATVNNEVPLRQLLVEFVYKQLMDDSEDYNENLSKLIDYLIVFEDLYDGDLFSDLKKLNFPSRLCFDKLIKSCERIIIKRDY
ncbi:MAG TPA: DUF2247 family protein [Saccharofermentans sp.]|nr:DUF2247 family protein [Saccharofermentans sp.]